MLRGRLTPMWLCTNLYHEQCPTRSEPRRIGQTVKKRRPSHLSLVTPADGCPLTVYACHILLQHVLFAAYLCFSGEEALCGLDSVFVAMMQFSNLRSLSALSNGRGAGGPAECTADSSGCRKERIIIFPSGQRLQLPQATQPTQPHTPFTVVLRRHRHSLSLPLRSPSVSLAFPTPRTFPLALAPMLIPPFLVIPVPAIIKFLFWRVCCRGVHL